MTHNAENDAAPMEIGAAFRNGLRTGEERAASELATARRVSLMYQRRTKDLAAVLLDARGLVRGMDAALDERIDAALDEGGFLSESTVIPPAEGSDR